MTQTSYLISHLETYKWFQIELQTQQLLNKILELFIEQNNLKFDAKTNSWSLGANELFPIQMAQFTVFDNQFWFTFSLCVPLIYNEKYRKEELFLISRTICNFSLTMSNSFSRLISTAFSYIFNFQHYFRINTLNLTGYQRQCSWNLNFVIFKWP